MKSTLDELASDLAGSVKVYLVPLVKVPLLSFMVKTFPLMDLVIVIKIFSKKFRLYHINGFGL